MLFALICTDKTQDGLKRRMENRPDHLAFLDSLGDTLKMAGPFLNDAGEEPRGSLVIIEAGSMDEARCWLSYAYLIEGFGTDREYRH